MPYYKATLTQGRTDTITFEAKSQADAISFLTTLSTARLSQLKKIVYSKDLLINYTYKSHPLIAHDKHLNIMVRTKNHTGVIVFPFPKKGLKKDYIISKAKQYLSFNGEHVEDVLSVVLRVDDE